LAVRISELSSRSGVPVATIKFYLREHVLHDGVRTAATQAQYDETHLARLALIRALIGVGGLSIARVQQVLHSIEHPPESLHDLLGMATAPTAPPADAGQDHDRVHALMREWGWRIEEKDCPTHGALAAALRALDDAGFVLPDEALRMYQQHMAQIAEYELATVPTDSPEAAVRYVVLGTVLPEPLLLVLRRMAQQEASARRFDRG
jgi:DNA-binding transcriptional MerR regulator